MQLHIYEILNLWRLPGWKSALTEKGQPFQPTTLYLTIIILSKFGSVKRALSLAIRSGEKMNVQALQDVSLIILGSKDSLN